jgi:hypothetical protein
MSAADLRRSASINAARRSCAARASEFSRAGAAVVASARAEVGDSNAGAGAAEPYDVGLATDSDAGPVGPGAEGGTGIGREARAGAKRARSARSAAMIRVSRGLSNCILLIITGAFRRPHVRKCPYAPPETPPKLQGFLYCNGRGFGRRSLGNGATQVGPSKAFALARLLEYTSGPFFGPASGGAPIFWYHL